MDIKQILKEPPIRAKVMGLLFIVFGIYLIIFQERTIYINIGFGAIFIGVFAIIVINEKIIPKKINDAQLLSNMELLHSIINNLDLKGNGVYLPAGGNLSKERVFIPVQKEEKYNLPNLDDDTVFLTGTDGSSLGVVYIPPGLGLLGLYEEEHGIRFKDIDIGKLEQYLQIMIFELGLIKDLSIKKMEDNIIKLKIKYSTNDEIIKKIIKDMEVIYRQTGGPICSSVLCAITRSLGQKVRIQKVDIKDNIISYKLKIGG